MPEWVGIAAMDTSYLTSNGAIMMAFQAEALPAGVEGRSGVVALNADGFVY